MNKFSLIASVILSIAVIGGAVYFSQRPTGTETATNSVREENGVQIVEIDAKGGYSPRTTTAKAGMPTTLRIETSGTYDCSSALTIPKLGFQKNLEATGVTEVPVPAQEPGAVIEGVCSMGMYSFEVRFEA